MLKGLDPLLGPDLLFTLRAMGHGDEIALVDGNYPAEEHGRRVIRADGHGVIALIHAVLSVMPLDDMVKANALLPKPPRPQPIHAAMRAAVARHEPRARLAVLAPDRFYARVKAAHAIIATGEPALYANIILRKGVIYPGG
jgi:L-fucose mutarotase